ncbi:MAG: Asp23/Gls24 family envelope stress response protein, partial [Erysipelotrichaceae bacterium]
YGVVGMASQKMVKDGIAELLKKDNYSRGVVVRQNEGNLELDLYIIVSHGIKISEVVHEVQKKVKYVLEKSLELDFNVINVFVQGVKVIK